MRYIELTEQNENDITPDMFVQMARDNCSDILKLYSKRKARFYRGMKNKTKSIFIDEPHVDRRPRDSSIETHEFMNIGLSLLKSPSNRSNSIAVTSSFFQAQMYGSPYIILPYNGFNYTYGTEVKDFASIGGVFNFYRYLVEKHKLYIGPNYGELVEYAGKNPKITLEYWNNLKNTCGITINKNLYKALASGNEVMISNTKYFAIKQGIFRDLEKQLLF